MDDNATRVIFGQSKDTWGTPQAFYDRLDAEFHFKLDVCAEAETAKCADYFTQEDDAFTKAWDRTAWMNPPYGRTIGRWLEQACNDAIKYGIYIVCLLPARTDTQWMKRYVHGHAEEVRFVIGRLTFQGAPDPAPFPSMIVIFGPHSRKRTTFYTIMEAKEKVAA